MSPIILGYKVKCIVTGFEGVVVTQAEYLHGCDRVSVQPPTKKDGSVPDEMTLDIAQIKVVGKKPIIEVKLPKVLAPLGVRAKDPITTYEGVVTGRALHINGCVRVALQGKHNQKTDKKFDVGVWFAEPQVTVLDKPKATVGSRDTGGPAPLKITRELDVRR